MLNVRRQNGVHTSRAKELFSVVATCGCILLEKKGVRICLHDWLHSTGVAMAAEAMVTTGA